MLSSPSARATLRLASLALLLAAAAGVWEVLATQAPGSPLYLGMLPGPVQALRETALVLGLLVFAAACLLPELHKLDQAFEPKALLAALHVGVVLALGAGVYGACTGMRGTQLFDLRPDASALFLTKHLGLVLTGAALAELARRALWRRGTRQLDP
ncbi:MAG TPA: hypothetical protein VF331_27980 [Polyangiales bacterium]